VESEVESEPVEPVESEPVESEVESKIESEPAPKHKKITKSFLKSDFKYLKKEDIDFILIHKIDEEGANEINNMKSAIDHYIKTLEIKELILDAVKEVLNPDDRNSATVLKWKNFMTGLIMQDMNKLKKPSQRELIRQSYSDLTLDDIEFIIDNNLGHDDITAMDIIRNRFIGFDKKEKIPRFETKKERLEYLEDLIGKKERTRHQYLMVLKDDSPAVQKWKKSYK
jgi:hypothetical protein